MTSKKRYISYSTRSMDIKLDRMVAYDKEPQTTKLNVFGDSLHDGFTWHHVTNEKKITSPFPRAMANKLDRVMAFEKGSPPSHCTIVRWPIKNISLFLQDSWLPNWTRWRLILLDHNAQTHVILWSRYHLLPDHDN